MASKERADSLLVSRNLCDSREQAKRLIMAGEVMSGTSLVAKPSTKLPIDAPLHVKKRPKYVGRGGLKIEGALDAFHIDPTGLVCLDVGASTGGFTDCLLQRGAIKVHAVDVGTNQLVHKLRYDPRVVVKEKFNARYMTPDDIGEPIDLAVTDVSFISLTRILPPMFATLKENGTIICLIKPQFELSKEVVSQGKGIIRDPALHRQAIDKIHDFVTEALNFTWVKCIDSPITGTDGNREFLALLKK